MVRIGKMLLVTFFMAGFTAVYGSNAAPVLEASAPQITSAEQEQAAGPRLTKVQYLENNSRALIPQMEGMQDNVLQATINNNLKTAIIPSDSSIEGNFEVSFYGDHLLSIHFWGNELKRDGTQAQKIDKGIHIDLTTGKIYKLEELFKPDADFENKIKEICSTKGSEYRYNHEIPTNIETYKNFASAWTKESGPFILLGDAIIVYSVPSEILGGYKIPYAELKDMINTDGELWNKIQGQKIHN